MKKHSFPVFAFCLAAIQLSAAPPLPEMEIPFREGTIVIDGKPGDSGWRNAAKLRIAFPPLDQDLTGDLPLTEVRIVYDDTKIYVAFFCRDEDIRSAGVKRDDPLHTGDVVEIFFDGSGDYRRIWEFQFNAAGLIRDVEYLFVGEMVLFDANGLWENMGQIREYPNHDLPGVCHAAGFLCDENGRKNGWLVETAFPRTALTGEPPRSELRANFVRYDYSDGNREPRMTFWSPTVSGRPHRSPGRLGSLIFRSKLVLQKKSLHK